MPAEWETHAQCWMGWPVRKLRPNYTIIVIIILFFFLVCYGKLMLRDRNVPITGVTAPFTPNACLRG